MPAKAKSVRKRTSQIKCDNCGKTSDKGVFLCYRIDENWNVEYARLDLRCAGNKGFDRVNWDREIGDIPGIERRTQVD